MNREEVVLERRHRATQPALQPPDLGDAPLEAPSEYLTSRQLARLLGYRGESAQSSANKFTKRHGLRRYWRSAQVALVRRADVEAVLQGRRQMGVSHGR